MANEYLKRRIDQAINGARRAGSEEENRRMCLVAIRAGASKKRIQAELGITSQALSQKLAKAREEEAER